MKATKKRCPLPFLILLATLWFARLLSLQLMNGLPARQLTLVEPPKQAYVQIIPGDGTLHREETWKEIRTP